MARHPDSLLPPSDLDAEEAVNGSLLIDSGCFNEIIGVVSREDFLSEANRFVFDACASLHERNVTIDQITVNQELEAHGVAEKVGSPAYLNHLISVVPTSLDIKYYAEIVKRLSVHRQLISAADKIAKLGYDVKPDVAPVLDQADELLLSIRKKASYTPIVTPHMRTEMMFQRYTDLYNATSSVAVKTGFSRLDFSFGGGFFNGEFVIFAGRPGMGKTTLLQQMANHQGQIANVLFASAEMPISSITDRDIASNLGYHIHVIRQGKYNEPLFDQIMTSLGQLAESKVYYLESKRGAPVTTARIMSAGLEMQMRYGLSAIFVDYLGLLADNFGGNPNERLGYISRQLKAIAMELDIPVITAHQLSRAVTQREGNEPQLSDLYESGHIEQDADAVVFIHRPDYYDRNLIEFGDGKPIQGKLIIAKERQGGRIGCVPVIFNQSKSMYFECETEISPL